MPTHHDVASTATPAAYDTPVPPACGTSRAPPPPTYGARSEPAPGGTLWSPRMVPPGNDQSSYFSATPSHMARLPTAQVLQPTAIDPNCIAASATYARPQATTPYAPPPHYNGVYATPSPPHVPFIPQQHQYNVPDQRDHAMHGIGEQPFPIFESTGSDLEFSNTRSDPLSAVSFSPSVPIFGGSKSMAGVVAVKAPG